MLKTCLKCKQPKPYGDFGTRKKNRDGKRNHCKECEKQTRVKYLSNPEIKLKIKLSRKKWYDSHREEAILRHKEWSVANRAHRLSWGRRNWLKKAYGITPEQYEVLAKAQGYKCKICGALVASRNRNYFYIDHCHKTKVIRGLLCSNCNMGIGYFKDDAARLLSAIQYLSQ